MQQKILDFLKKERICSLSIILSDGSPHAAIMHFSHQDSPLTLFFSTDRDSVKCQGFSANKTTKASIAIGFSEEEWISLQLDGEVSIVDSAENVKHVKSIHYVKNPGSKEFENDPNTIFLLFTPRWWRYTDFNTDPPTTISSENK